MSVSSLLMVDISEEGVEPLSVGNSLSPGFDYKETNAFKIMGILRGSLPHNINIHIISC